MNENGYRKSQFDRLGTKESEYPPKIKIVDENGQTNWMNIAKEELQKIREILV